MRSRYFCTCIKYVRVHSFVCLHVLQVQAVLVERNRRIRSRSDGAPWNSDVTSRTFKRGQSAINHLVNSDSSRRLTAAMKRTTPRVTYRSFHTADIRKKGNVTSYQSLLQLHGKTLHTLFLCFVHDEKYLSNYRTDIHAHQRMNPDDSLS